MQAELASRQLGWRDGFGIGLVRDWVVSSVVVGPDRTVLGLVLGRGRAWVWPDQIGPDRVGHGLAVMVLDLI